MAKGGGAWMLRVGSREREVKSWETVRQQPGWNGIVCLVGKLLLALRWLGNQVPGPRRGPGMEEDWRVGGAVFQSLQEAAHT